MNKQQLLKLIRESRPLLKTATPEQKLKLLKLIREGYQQVKQADAPWVLMEEEAEVESILAESEALDADYLEEK